MTDKAISDCIEAMEMVVAPIAEEHGLESLDIRVYREEGETMLFFTAQDGDGTHSFNTTRESR